MGEKPKSQVYPRRDDDGRVMNLVEMVAASLLGTGLGVLAVLVIDGVLSALNLDDFGSSSGWLAAILPAFLFVDDFRAWKGGAGWRRWPVALVGFTAGLGAGLAVAGLANDLPNLVSGALGAAGLALIYPLAWFSGIRLMER